MAIAPRGSVGIETFKGRLRLRLPRVVAADSSRYISSGLEATAENTKTAQRVAWTIEDDLKTGQLDATLVKYKALLNPVAYLNPQVKPRLDLGQLWDKYCAFKRSQVAVTTYHQEYVGRYAYHIERLPTRDLEQAVAIRDYLVGTLPANTVKRVLTRFSACCDFAVKSKLIPDNPFQGFASDIMVRTKDDIDPFTLAERDAIIHAFDEHPCHHHYAAYVRFLFMTGCRTGEAIALQWQYINQDCTIVTFAESYSERLKLRKDTKTGVTRQFPCNVALSQLLKELRPSSTTPDTSVFTSPTGLPINASKFVTQVWRGGRSGSKVYQGIVTALVKYGQVVRYRSPYNTRHSFITYALDAGVPVTQVAKWCGNSPEVIYKHYAGSLSNVEVPIF